MAKHAMSQVTAEGDSYPEASAHSGHSCSEAFRSFPPERKGASGPFVLGKLVCFETVRGCQEIASLQQGVQAASSPVYYDCLE